MQSRSRDCYFGLYSVLEHFDQKYQKRSIAKIVFFSLKAQFFSKNKTCWRWRTFFEYSVYFVFWKNWAFKEKKRFLLLIFLDLNPLKRNITAYCRRMLNGAFLIQRFSSFHLTLVDYNALRVRYFLNASTV